MASLDGLSGLTYRAEAAAWTFFGVSSVIFCLRCIVRINMSDVGWRWDDAVLLVSWALNIVRMTSLQLALTSIRHIDLARLSTTAPSAIFWALFTSSWAFLSITLPKIAVGILLVRIFRPGKQTRRAILWTPIALCIYCFVGLVISFVQCQPAAALWNPWQHPDATCWPSNVVIYYAEPGAATSALLDLAFAAYPIVQIWQLRMRTWQKLTAMCLMSLGLVSFTCAVTKIYYNTIGINETSVDGRLTAFTSVGLWSGLENDFVFAAASLPSTRPLLAKVGQVIGRRWHRTGSEQQDRAGEGDCRVLRARPSLAESRTSSEPNKQKQIQPVVSFDDFPGV